MKRAWCAALAFACLVAMEGTIQAEASPAGNEQAQRAERVSDVRGGTGVQRTKRIALIPLIDRTGGWLTKSGAERLTDRMDRELHIPLNKTMHWAEILDEDASSAALGEALDAQGKKKAPELAAREAAKKLDADLVLFLVVDRFYQQIFHRMTWEGETYIESSVSLTVYGYDTRHDRLIKAPASRFEITDYHPAYEVEELAVEALDEALREAHVADVIFPLSESRGASSKADDSSGTK